MTEGVDSLRKSVKLASGLRFRGYKTRRELAGESLSDNLTGLLNRNGWNQKVSEYLKHGERTGENVSFIFIDLDDLKTTNDTKGHDAGDDILKGFSKILTKIGRQSDLIARYGGDEFTICLPATGLDEANKMKDRLLENAGDIKISVGIGTTLEDADNAMYKMKKLHKNG
ncbi:MAG: GGDEF domain-containing protein [Candidatus Woesebacteria bacterium]|nr:GGDEF domain-containing protein [Candidatus Woesebacteria bacterium]